MTKTLMDAKVGDVVTLRGVVGRVDDEGVYFDFGETDDEGRRERTLVRDSVPPENIVSIEPAPLKVGNRVKRAGFGWAGCLLAIDDQRAWVRLDDGSYCQPLLDELERVP